MVLNVNPSEDRPGLPPAEGSLGMEVTTETPRLALRPPRKRLPQASLCVPGRDSPGRLIPKPHVFRAEHALGRRGWLGTANGPRDESPAREDRGRRNPS